MKKSFALVGVIFVASALQGCATSTMFPAGGGCATAKGLCRVDITVPAGCTTGACVRIPDVHVGDGSGNATDVNVLWRLPHGYAFCDKDGIAFKPGDGGQFSDPYATDDANGGHGGNGPRNHFHWKDANTAKGKFSYGFRFHDQACTAVFEKDPVVINDM